MTTKSGQPVALITGASRHTGLGLETARQLGRKGYTVLLTARDLAKVDPLAANLRDEGIAAPLDVDSDQSVAGLADHVTHTFCRIDALVNNANAVYDAGGTPLETDLAVARQALETALFGAWRMSKAFATLLKRSPHGRIVNVGSGAGTFSDPAWGLAVNQQGVAAYSIAKVALHAFTVKLAAELKPSGVLVNAVCPGFVATYEGTEAYGARPVPDGAAGIVWAAILPPDGPTGRLFRDGKPIGW